MKRVLTSHDACTSGISWVLTEASLQQLKLEALIPAPVDCQSRSLIKFLNAQSILQIENHRQLFQVYEPNVWASRWCVDGAHDLQQVDNMCMMRSALGGHQSLRTTLWSLCGNALWRTIASQLRKSAVISRRFPAPYWIELTRSTVVHTVFPIPGGRLPQKLVLQYDKYLNSGLEYVEK